MTFRVITGGRRDGPEDALVVHGAAEVVTLAGGLRMGSAMDEPATLASNVLGLMRDRPLAIYLGDDGSFQCVPACALGEVEVDDIVGVYSGKAARDAIADDIRAYVEARFGSRRVSEAVSRRYGVAGGAAVPAA